MNSTSTSVGGRAPPRRSRRRAQDRVRPPQLPDLLLELLDPRRLSRGHPRLHPVVDLGLLDPATQRLGADPELLGDSSDRAVIMTELLAHLADHPHRPFLLRLAIPALRK